MPFSPKRAGSVVYSLVMFVIVSVLAGVLVAGLFVPIAGMAGVGSKAAATELESLPAELATPAPPTRSRVLMGNGKTLGYFFDENRVPIKLSQVAPVMRQAQLAIEDHRYYEHGAIDLKGTLRALIRNQTSDTGTQGGSSITQQYVKMVQIEACKSDKKCVAAAQVRTMKRKIRELRYAVALERKFTKDQILERYLNIAYYGDGAYGIQSAAKHYFDVPASELTLPQAAMLAGLVQNPDSYNPVQHPAAASDRRDVVLNRMVELKIITLAQSKKAKKVEFDTKDVKVVQAGCNDTRYPFLCDYVKRTLLDSPALGKTATQRRDALYRGGLTIKTAIDPKTQDLAQEKVSSVVAPTDPLISTMNMIQPGTGLIVASAQSRPVMGSNEKKGQTYWNLSADVEHGGIQGYQAGSTFKAFTIAAALEKGIPISKKFNAKSPMDFSGKRYESCSGNVPVYGKFKVANSVLGYNRTINMTTAAEGSVNTYFVQLELAAGMCNVTKMAQKLGVKVGQQIGDPPVDIVKEYNDKPSFTLGTAEVSPMSMAEAYATFAARGVHCDPIIVSKITNAAGKSIPVPSANCKQVLDPDVADGVSKVLKSVMDNGTGKRAKVLNGYDQAGKTGTIDSNRAVWFAGYTPEAAGVAMISVDGTRKPFDRDKSGYISTGVKHYYVPSTDRELEGSGSGDAGAKIWEPVMEKYLKTLPDTKFEQPSRNLVVGKKVRLPYLSYDIDAATKKLEKLGFTVERRYVYSSRDKYAFLGWSPGSYATVPQYSTVYANFSKGKDPAIEKAKKAAAKEKAAKEKAAKEKAAAAKKAAEDKKKKAGG
ncbi:transglycosylase domain-containing protein [uncultured Friedmanniella sp.]|uniref:transglycosylase domain-containing protein n=1 Tax=uncultured Friedmanniella sp. TaxID=335381 RepID=UPI0035C945A6